MLVLALTEQSSTPLGSITLSRAAHYLPAPAYKISKAAMNALTVQYALDYEKEGFTFMALCPGVCTLLVPLSLHTSPQSPRDRLLTFLGVQVDENRPGRR